MCSSVSFKTQEMCFSSNPLQNSFKLQTCAKFLLNLVPKCGNSVHSLLQPTRTTRPADHLDNFGKLSTRAFLSEAHIPPPVSKPYRAEQSSLQLFCFISILFLLCLNVIQSNRKSILNSDAFSSYIKVIKGFTVYTQNEKYNWKWNNMQYEMT